jgi:A/G-specific adenine glycosylase
MNFANELVQWYHENKRDLPWRNTTDPYIIWLSEIILQQTRVEQGMPYFNRFLENYPTVTAFAAADEGEILKLWQGLGYYSRGRNMLKTAQLVQELYNGAFPSAYDDLIKLKGIGEYTASAISSFAANEAKAVVDGNVYRVLARYYGIDEPINSTKGRKMFQQLANNVLNQEQPGLHNQAMMEFGAMLCKPKNPACGICPVRTGCEAFKHNATTVLPVKLKTVKIRERYFNYLVVVDGTQILMNKRTGKDIWAGMYDLPLIETSSMLPVSELIQQPSFKNVFNQEATIGRVSEVQKFVLTHQHLMVRFLEVNNMPAKMEPDWFFSEIGNLNQLALPKMIFLFLTKFFKFEDNYLLFN